MQAIVPKVTAEHYRSGAMGHVHCNGTLCLHSLSDPFFSSANIADICMCSSLLEVQVGHHRYITIFQQCLGPL